MSRLDFRCLNVALRRAERKMILMASRRILWLFRPDEAVFAYPLWRENCFLRQCSTLLWPGERGGKRVAVWGGKGDVAA